MTDRLSTYRFTMLVAMLFMVAASAFAQTELSAVEKPLQAREPGDTLSILPEAVLAPDVQAADSTYREITASFKETGPDSAAIAKNKTPGNVKLRKPDPATATWLALAIPGGGQIYNRKFWKLPIVYGGFVGCLYAYNWNTQMYKDYRQAFLDIMDSDPNTDSYKDFFRPGYDFDSNKEYLSEVFKRRKDLYRRWRDLSIFSFIGVYAISVIDAYVDAQLSNFDISEDIHLSIEPDIINDRRLNNDDYYGFNFSITF